MPPKKKGGGGGRGGGDKKSQLWDAIRMQKLAAVRYGIANSGIHPASRNHEGLTTFQLCARDGYDKSLAEMIRWYERRDAELRRCLSEQDESRRTSLAIACAAGKANCVKLLLSAADSVDRDGSFCRRQLAFKDTSGKTPRDAAASAAVREILDDFLASDDEDEDEDEEGNGDLTSTQLSKLKKLALIEQETGVKAGEARAAAAAGGDENESTKVEERGDLPSEMPTPRWPEVVAWAESVKQLRPICELRIEREAASKEDTGLESEGREGSGAGKGAEDGNDNDLDTSIDAVLVEAPPPGAMEEDAAATPSVPPPPPPAGEAAGGAAEEVVDPALWFCHTVNRLELKLPAVLRDLRSDGLVRLSALTTLILHGNTALVSLPDSVADLPLKHLDASHCALATLPTALPAKTLETLDVSFNGLETLGPGVGECVQLVKIAVDGNRLTSLSELPFEGLGRLTGLTASGNELTELDPRAGLAVKLECLVLSNNPLVVVPAELAACKKLKQIKIDGCPVKDSKVKKYIEKEEIKNLLKYLEKQGPSGGGGAGGGKKGKGKKK